MKKHSFLLSALILILLSSFFSYKACFFIAEKYFFDKFFYKKSIKHGYLFCDDEGCHLKRYGKRSEDIEKLYLTSKSTLETSRVLGKSVNDVFTIAVYGDSYVWGQGVLESERLTSILEKKLNRIRNTRVLSFGWPGDSALDNLLKYQMASERFTIDMSIFVLVKNDLLLRESNQYPSATYEEIKKSCTGLENDFVYNEDSDSLGYDYIMKLVFDSYHNKQNLCVLEKVLELYPKENAIYFVTQEFILDPESYTHKYIESLERAGLYVTSYELANRLPKYEHYWDNKPFLVSKMEGHPSKYAHEMYADALFEEITSNPQWGFVNDL